MFRGFVMWYFLAFWPGTRFGLVIAVVISSLLFGFGHIYFGVRQVRVSAIGGLFFAAIALAAGSLVPAMIVHAALDWHSFDLGYRALRETGESGAAPAVPAVVINSPRDSPPARRKCTHAGVAPAAECSVRQARLTARSSHGSKRPTRAFVANSSIF